MKTGLRAFGIAFAIMAGMESSHSQWTKITGPAGGRVVCMTTAGTKVFAGTDNGVFVSNDNGSTWNESSVELAGVPIRRLIVSGANLFAIADNYVIMSSDSGARWGVVANFTDYGCYALAAYPAPSGSVNLLVGTHRGVFFAAGDAKWHEPSPQLENISVSLLTACPNDSGGMVVFAGTDKGIFRSSDNGASWSKADSGIGKQTIRTLQSCPATNGGSTLYASTFRDIYVSTDLGATWRGLKVDSLAQSASVFTTSGSDILVGTIDKGIVRSSDGGDHWAQSGTGLERNSVYSLILPEGNGTGKMLLAGTQEGLLCSYDNGVSWHPSNTGLAGHVVYKVVAQKGGLLIGTESGVFRSTDGGTRWLDINDANSRSRVTALEVDGNEIMVSTSGAGAFVRSFDNGQTWYLQEEGLKRRNIEYVAKDANGLYAAVYGGVLRQSGGYIWSESNTGLRDTHIRGLAQLGGNVFAATDSGVYTKWKDSDLWTPSNIGLEGKTVLALISADKYLFAGTETGVSWYATDQPYWTEAFQGLKNTPIRSLTSCPDGKGGTNVYAGGYSGGIYLSADYGKNWRVVDTVATRTGVRSLAVSGSTLYAVLNNGSLLKSDQAVGKSERPKQKNVKRKK